jgi:hypothetical protein
MATSSNPFPFLFMLVGVLALAGGAWWIYHPAGVMVLGFTLLALGLFGRGGPNRPEVR